MWTYDATVSLFVLGPRVDVTGGQSVKTGLSRAEISCEVALDGESTAARASVGNLLFKHRTKLNQERDNWCDGATAIGVVLFEFGARF